MIENKEIHDVLKIKFDAGTSLIQIVSHEWRRILAATRKAITICTPVRTLYWWNKAEALRKWDPEDEMLKPEIKDKDLVSEIIKWAREAMPNNSVLVVENIHLWYSNQKELLIDQIRSIARIPSTNFKSIILLGSSNEIPNELSTDVYILDLPLPDNRILQVDLKEAYTESKLDINILDKEEKRIICQAALGLTENEAKITFKEIIAEKNRLTKSEVIDVLKRKEQIIRKSGILEYIHPDHNLNDVGGMDMLKNWLGLNKRAFEPDAKKFGILEPKGILLLGIPGCGKSLIAKAIGTFWDYPLLKFEFGKVFGGIVGESEGNIRKALSVANAVAPCILWIDEIEKGLSGVQSSGKLDSGVTSRVFGTFLTWMQERDAPVFVVATANNILDIPAEFLRKGRFSEIFFVDLPGPKSREDIWRIHLKKRMQNRYDNVPLNIPGLVKQSIFYSGSEIEEAINLALLAAYNQDREVVTKDFLDSLQSFFPLSKTMVDSIQHLRNWSKMRVKLASSEIAEVIPNTDNLPILPSEKQNWTFD